MKHYNLSIDVLHQHGHSEIRELTWEEIRDICSSIYQINISANDGIPIAIKRNVVPANLNKRLCEEDLHLLNDMKNCVDSFYPSCMSSEKSLNDLDVTSNDDDNEESKEKCDDDELKKGIYAIQSKELYKDRVNLCAAYNMFVDCLSLPDEIVNYVKQLCQSNDNKVSETDSEDDVEYEEEIHV